MSATSYQTELDAIKERIPQLQARADEEHGKKQHTLAHETEQRIQSLETRQRELEIRIKEKGEQR